MNPSPCLRCARPSSIAVPSQVTAQPKMRSLLRASQLVHKAAAAHGNLKPYPFLGQPLTAASHVFACQRHSSSHICSAAAQAEAAAPLTPNAAQLESWRSQLQFYNTMSRQKEVFTCRPGHDKQISMYVCGVTVYDYSHIGEPWGPSTLFTQACCITEWLKIGEPGAVVARARNRCCCFGAMLAPLSVRMR